jgi:hypothetical protein
MSEEQPVFKVTDRRLFNPDGTPREIERTEETKTETAAAQNSQAVANERRADASQTGETSQAAGGASASSEPAASNQQAAGASDADRSAVDSTREETIEQFPEDDYAESGIPGADDPASFINFLMSIASNAAASLGMMEHPVTGERSVDPELAKHWIDVLGMLQQKTRGNLDPQERQIFEGLLADLRMQYVSLTSARAPKAPRGFTGSDITGGR